MLAKIYIALRKHKKQIYYFISLYSQFFAISNAEKWVG